MKWPTRVAIYTRVSTTEQAPEGQLLALRAYVAQQGEPHPFLVVPPLFMRNPPGREDLAVSRISVRKSAHA